MKGKISSLLLLIFSCIIGLSQALAVESMRIPGGSVPKVIGVKTVSVSIGKTALFAVGVPRYREVTAAGVIDTNGRPSAGLTLAVVSVDAPSQSVRLRVSASPNAVPGNYRLVLTYGSSKELAPYVFVVRRTGPDLKVLDYNLSTNVIRVTNIGNEDAVFPQGGLLLSHSDPTHGGTVQMHGVVPPGGRITPGQIISIGFQYPPEWICPVDPNASLQYGFFRYTWAYALPRPIDGEGRWLQLVDPDGKVAEADETNNVYQFTRPNPTKGTLQGTGVPDVVISKVEVTKIPTANGQYLDVYFKNIGTTSVYSCGPKISNGPGYSGIEILNGYVDGSNLYTGRGAHQANTLMRISHPQGEPLILHPGEERKVNFFLSDEVNDAYGRSNGGLRAGCHEVKLEIDPGRQIPGETSCNNRTTYYFASGNGVCDSTKVMTTSRCMTPIQVQPQLLRNNQLPRAIPLR